MLRMRDSMTKFWYAPFSAVCDYADGVFSYVVKITPLGVDIDIL